MVVLDSVGVGELPDAALYGDTGSNTLGNTAMAVGGLKLPNLGKLGLGNIIPILGVPPTEQPAAAWGKMAEQSAGKDTTTGHWEIAGLVLDRPFPTYPEGFPPEILEAFEQAIGRKTLGNYPASGTEIIAELGEEHIKTGYPIVYTSADSVFQVAAHEGVVPLETLYEWCQIARDLLQGEHGVGRVIARPFVGEPGNFVRTAGRRDFSLEPPAHTILDVLVKSGIPVYSVGKIMDIFAGRGITHGIPTKNNQATIDGTIEFMQTKDAPCLIFANCVDFDMLWGHRNNPEGYAKGLQEFDERLPEILEALRPRDILLLLADHGCDPTTSSTDHSREYVPLLVVGEDVRPQNLGIRETYADTAQTIAELFGVEFTCSGRSFAHIVKD
ncbi:MAG: phosphopentomutase [Firmicutes bacterium]|jgi:phosphopentomutase|nr:phosphopentomutase [Bacillota bacterium]